MHDEALTPQARASAYDRGSYRIFALAMLMTAYVFNFIDRQILAILQEPIKAELGLSDTQLGLLTGFAFAMFYVVMGIPIARLADKGVRRTLIIASSVGVWSLFTALSGFAGNYLQLMLARIGVGVGEAGCSPPAHSMISDIFPPRERATAFSIYNIGISIGILFGFLLGGWLNEYFGWRIAFMAVGIPGVILAVILRLTLKEPERGRFDKAPADSGESPSMSDVLKLLWQFRTFRHLLAAVSLYSLAGYGLLNWLPSFFIRTHALSTGTVGTWFAMILGVGGAIGVFTGGYLSDRLGRRDSRWYCWTMVLLMGAGLPMTTTLLLVDDAESALWLFVYPGAVGTVYLAPILAVTHGLIDNRMRALSSAILFLVLNSIGLGLGPVLIGFISDGLSASQGTNSLRYAMLAVVPVSMGWAIVHTLLAARHIRDEYQH